MGTNKTEHDKLAPSALTQGRVEATLAGQSVAGRYDVLELVGVGGMGAVYRARDRELDEVVALKVIKRELAAIPAMVERFRHEVKLARRVTHVNVARTFELGIADGVMFCTMELVEGESLTKRLARGRIPIGEAVSIASAVCDGLAAAHAAQVIHRDIKPDNVLLASDGRVVVADFGVAAVGVDAPGELSGTPAYMAPEQARGEPATPAADVYSIGVVLREMVTGQRTYGASADGVPEDLVRVIDEATTSSVERRIAKASLLRRALEPWARSPRATTASPKVEHDIGDLITIVVMPPMAPAGEPTLYLAEAVHEEMLARLIKLPRVRVLPRACVEPDENVIGVCLDVESGLHVRITHPSGPPTTLHFPLTVDHILSTADAVAATLGSAIARQRAVMTGSGEAYDLLLTARHMVNRDVTKMPDAIVKLRRAHELAPDEPRIMANLAIAQVRMAFFRPDDAGEAIGGAVELAKRAVSIAPDIADTQISAGHVELMAGNPIAAARHFRIAIARAPQLAEAHEQLGRMLLEAGYLEAALDRLEESIAIAPNLRSARWEIARAWALEGRWDEHERLVTDLTAGGVDRPLSRARYAWWRRDWATLESLRQQISSLDRTLWPGMMDAVTEVFLDGAWLKYRDELIAGVKRDIPSRRRKTFVCQLATEGAAFSNDVDAVIELVQHATQFGLFDLHWLERCDLLALLRDHPRYAELRAPIKQRADAILDALYGDQSVALSETAIA
ncbi:MAG TPA: protein kinase [Kofleriaceae bacterium]